MNNESAQIPLPSMECHNHEEDTFFEARKRNECPLTDLLAVQVPVSNFTREMED